MQASDERRDNYNARNRPTQAAVHEWNETGEQVQVKLAATSGECELRIRAEQQ